MRLERVTRHLWSPKFEFFILNPHYYDVIEHSLKCIETCFVLLINAGIRILESSDESINCMGKFTLLTSYIVLIDLLTQFVLCEVDQD